MQDRYDTINLEYVETRKSSRLAKLTATTLSVVFTFTPISEFITTLNNEFYDMYLWYSWKLRLYNWILMEKNPIKKNVLRSTKRSSK